MFTKFYKYVVALKFSSFQISKTVRFPAKALIQSVDRSSKSLQFLNDDEIIRKKKYVSLRKVDQDTPVH